MGRVAAWLELGPVSAHPLTEAKSEIVYILIIINYIMGNCSSMKDDPGDSIEASNDFYFDNYSNHTQESFHFPMCDRSWRLRLGKDASHKF